MGQGLLLQRLRLPQFKNLRDLNIHFSAYGSPAIDGEVPKRFSSHAVIGQNGTGKSNLIEALITIFRDVDLDREAAFDYTLEYSIRGHAVRIEADTVKQRRPFVWVDGKAESQGYLLKNRELLPAHIFAYYSGRNEPPLWRLNAVFVGGMDSPPFAMASLRIWAFSRSSSYIFLSRAFSCSSSFIRERTWPN